MTARVWTVIVFTLLVATSSLAQDLGAHFRKIADGIYVQSAREVNSNVGIILTTEGVVLIDSGQTLIDTREVADAVKKLTPLPVELLVPQLASPSTTHLPEARPEGKAAPEAPQQPAEGAKVVALETFRKK